MADSKFRYDPFKYEERKDSTDTKNARKALDSLKAPDAYKSKWQSQLDNTMNAYNNREKFKYDVNGDALYQQYKDKFTQQGKMAMQDTMGQAAAMTGGYGNSYAATVGNQAYQGAMKNLNDVIPELYSLALERYQQEGQDMLNKYSLLSDRENTDYGRYRDEVSDYYTNRDYLAGRYDTERSLDMSKYDADRAFAYGQYSDAKNLAYTDYRNGIADDQWEKNYEEGVRQYNQSMKYQKDRDDVEDYQWQQSYGLQKDAADAAVTQEMLEEGYSVDDATKIDRYMTDLIDNGGSRAEAERFLEMLLSGNASLNQEILDNYFGPEDAVDTTVADMTTYQSGIRQLQDKMKKPDDWEE